MGLQDHARNREIGSFPFIVSSQSQDKLEQTEKGGAIGEEKQNVLIGGSKEAWRCSRSSSSFRSATWC